MKNRLILAAVLATAIVLMPAKALAWGQEGHRIIAKIAYDHLTPAARAHVNRVLGLREGAIYYANWPDEIKSDTIYPTSSNWHYQDFNAGMSDSAVIAALTDYPKEGGNLFRATDSIIALLKKDPNQLDNLRFLIHFSGDRFCPMHTAHMDDQGGNWVKVTWFQQKTNLHAIWDSKIIDSQGYTYTEYASYLEHKYGKQRKVIRKMTEEEIVVNNYHLCNEIYAYQETWNGSPYKYVYRWKDAMEWQLYVAGIRLAKLLNKLY